MSIRNQDVFELYRPLRNQLSRFNLLDSLFVIWGYSRNYTFNYEFPRDIEMPQGFNPSEPNLNTRKYRGLFDHEMEFLLKEIIINCDICKTKYSLREVKHFAKLMNYYRSGLSDGISKKYSTVDNILLEYKRIAHSQFKWQLGHNRSDIFKYYQIYTDPILSKIIEAKLNLTVQQLFLIGFLFYMRTGKHFKTQLPLISNVKALTNEMIEIFIKHFSIKLEDAKIELKKFQQINENIFYSFNPLMAKPLLIENNNILCPIPILVFWQITNGIYYSIHSEDEFDSAYGNAFQTYADNVLQKSFTNSKIKIYPEEKYGKPERSTTDIIVTDDESILFIECKTKRMRFDSKYSVEKEILEKDLKKMAVFVTQVYKTYLDYCENLYPSMTTQNIFTRLY